MEIPIAVSGPNFLPPTSGIFRGDGRKAIPSCPEWPKPQSWEHGSLVLAGLDGFEPHQNRPARHGVLSKPQIRQEKTVNHIFRGEMNAHDLIDRNMQIVVELYVVVVPNLPSGPG